MTSKNKATGQHATLGLDKAPPIPSQLVVCYRTLVGADDCLDGACEDPRAHFGLGRAKTVRELIIRYPGGRETRLQDVAANQILAVRR